MIETGVVAARPARPHRRERPASDYSQLLASMQSLRLLERRYTYYAVKISILVAAFAGVWTAFAIIGDRWAQVALAVALAVVITQIVFLSHDAAHRQIFRSARANEITALIFGVLIGGVSLSWWNSKHTKHHAAPNHVGVDTDIDSSIVHFYPAVNPPKSRVAQYLHEHQGVWFFPLLIVEALNLHAQTVVAVLTRPTLKNRWLETALLTIRLLGYPALLFTLLSPGKAAVFLGVQLAVTGLYLGSSFAASHIGKPVVPHDSRIDFFRRQVLLSRNVLGGRVASVAMGGLNYQIEHHLFPSMPRPNLRRARPIVQNFCADRAVDYEEVTVWQAWATVVRYLNRVGLAARNPFACPVVAALR